MGFDLVKTTPLMEYLDMLYTRLAIEIAKHPEVTRWWVEVHPPDFVGDRYLHEEDNGTVGYIVMKAWTPLKTIDYRADFMAAQRGARAGTEILEQVVEHHVSKFAKALTA